MEESCKPTTLKDNSIIIQIKGIEIQIEEYEELINGLEIKMQPLLLADVDLEPSVREDERADSSPAINQMYMKASKLYELNKRMKNIVNRIDL